MGTLGLDLSGPQAKLLRACEHLKALKRETDIVLAKRCPYSLTVSEIDPETGWCSILLAVDDIPEPSLGLIFGDFMNNLRSALDHTVAELARASGVAPTTKHQFPICDREANYRRLVGAATAPKKDGPLGGIVHGLEIIERLQPYQYGPHARGHPLWWVKWFSNADKHREIAALIPLVGNSYIDVEPAAGVLERWQPDALHVWSSKGQYVVGRLRYAPPFPTEVKAQSNIAVVVVFSTSPIGNPADGHAIKSAMLPQCYRAVEMTLQTFEAL